jgi:hypothetical protein
MRNMQNTIYFEVSYKIVFIAGYGRLCSFGISLLFVLCEYRQFMEGVVTFHHEMYIGI